MKYIRHILPLVGIVLATVIIFQMFYIGITGYEEKRCWQELKTTVEDLNKEIQIKFTDEISKLHLVETLMINGGFTSADNAALLHLDKIQPGTMFTRIDILYPDNTLVSNGEQIEIGADISFDKIKASGEYLTNRKTDFMNGKPCVYYVLPVMDGGEIRAVLIGVVDCETLHELFKPMLYNGEANVCIIDADDGNYIMDNWHSTLGNMFEMEERELLSDFADVDFKAEIKNLKSGTIAFVSKTTGQNIYMYYAPLNIFGWEIAVFTNDDIIFANLVALRKGFIIAGIVELLLLFLYFFWNIHLIKKMQRANCEIKQQQERLEFLSYHDVLTGLYNRHKYFEALSVYMQKKPKNIGVVFVDLNGLKAINDTSSHEAGDEYICTAAGILTQVFGESAYRIGGDEFVAVLSDVMSEDFEAKTRELCREAKNQNVSLAIGTMWRAECDDINEMIADAEKEMYSNKKDYYEKLN